MTAIVGAGRNFTITSTPGLFLEQQLGRGYLAIQNNGTADVLVGLGVAPTDTTGRKIASGTSWEPQNVPGDAVYMKTVSGSATVVVFAGSPNR